MYKQELVLNDIQAVIWYKTLLTKNNMHISLEFSLFFVTLTIVGYLIPNPFLYI